MTKFLALGMTLPQVVAATTVNAAIALRRPDLGTLNPGSPGDASVIALDPIPTLLEDVLGETIAHPACLTARGRVMAGIWHS